VAQPAAERIMTFRVTPLEKLATGIPGFDAIAMGGLPRGRATLITGTAGSGKTIFATQFLVAGVEAGESVVFATFEETPHDICQNVISMGWSIPALDRPGTLVVRRRFSPARR